MENRPSTRFETNCLLSKWGFWDGDLLDDLMHENGFPLWFSDRHPAWDQDYAVPSNPGAHFGFGDAVLIEVVRQHVAPFIDQKVEVSGFSGHNPVRAVLIDGREVPYDVY